MRAFCHVVFAGLLAAGLAAAPAAAQQTEPPAETVEQRPAVTGPAGVMIPNFWDRHERFPKPDIATIGRLKFLTTTDFPPFNFIDRKKRLTGFHVDLAREICRTLDILLRCQIQAVPWDDLLPELEKGEAEAIIAGLATEGPAAEKLAFTRRFLRIPARFVMRKDSGLEPPAFTAVFRKKTGVVAGSAHKAYFEAVFASRGFEEFPTREAALTALKDGSIDAVFSDALSLSFWLSSEQAGDCCVFLDGAFLSREHFGDGLSIAVPADQENLLAALNFALAEINRNGKFAELYLRYFPLGLF